MTETPLVDAHVHVFTRDMPLIDNPRHAPTYDFTVEQLIATMDAHGVQFAVIAAASPWGDYNDYTIAALRAHPRLRGTVIERLWRDARVLAIGGGATEVMLEEVAKRFAPD